MDDAQKHKMMTTASTRRILKELKDWEVSPPDYCAAGPVNDDVYQWSACVMGPVIVF